MAVVKPFRGLLPKSETAARVAAVPYDVVNTEEAAALAKGNSLSFLRVSRPEIELEPGVDLHDDKVYAKAAENFKRLRAEAPLEMDQEPHIYVYSLLMGGHRQTGIAAAFSTEDYDKDVIKKHEKTRKDKEDDRARHVMELRSHTGPVFLTYRDFPETDRMIQAETSRPPLFDFTAADGVRHTFWKIDAGNSEKLSELFKKVDTMYIADGHHRAASASRAAASCRKDNPAHTGAEDYNFFLAVAFPASQLRILPYNRVVKDLNGRAKEQFLKEVSRKFKVSDAASPVPGQPGRFCMLLGGKWLLLEPLFDTSTLGVTERLDVSVLQDNILGPLLGVDDPRTSKRVDFVGGIRGAAELERLVASGKFEVAFSMHPTTVAQLMEISDAGAIMPPKSTWFEPKLRDGIVCHNF